MSHVIAGRRWFQFGLREMFWLSLVVALALFSWNEHRDRARLERENAEWIVARNEWFERYMVIEPLKKKYDKLEFAALKSTVQLWCMQQGWDCPEELHVETYTDKEFTCVADAPAGRQLISVNPKTLEVLGATPVKDTK